MINEKEVCQWIEKKNNIKLYPTQERFISSLINGCDINCPRGFGRTSLVKWYSEYLNEVYSKKPFDYNSECYITLKEFIDDRPEHVNIEANVKHVLEYLSKEKFEKDYVANYNDYVPIDIVKELNEAMKELKNTTHSTKEQCCKQNIDHKYNVEKIKAYYYNLIGRYENNEINAMIKTCAEFDLYYSNKLFDLTYNNLNFGIELISCYLRNLNLVQYKDKTFKDSKFD